MRTSLILMALWCLVLSISLLLSTVKSPAEEQAQLQSWQIWKTPGGKLFKVQDGQCSVYIAVYNGNVGVATGQGCR